MRRADADKLINTNKNHSRWSKHCSNSKLGLVILLDIFLAGLGLVIFALFHHVLPRDLNIKGQVLPIPSSTEILSAISSEEISETTELLGASQDESIPPSTTSVVESSDTNPNPIETTQEETTRSGAWAEKFADKFTSGAVAVSDNAYISETQNITIKQVSEDDVTYYIADIYLRDIQFFRTAFAGGSYARGRTAAVIDIADENQAVLAISGDYYGIRDNGVVIRNGALFREALFDDVLLMYYDGSMETFTRETFDIEQIKIEGAWQAWSFGPMLLDQGQPMTSFNSSVTRLNPRCAIGYYEPGHYCFVLVDGRQPDYSVGMTMEQLSQLFYNLGCKVAYNLDGGQSAVMVFNGQIVNQPYKGGRNVSDIIYISE